jgi:hypothetical protein
MPYLLLQLDFHTKEQSMLVPCDKCVIWGTHFDKCQ